MLTCTDCVDFRNCQDRCGRFSWSRNDSNYLDVKLKVFKKDDNKEFRLAQSLTMGEADFNQFMRLSNQLVIAAKNFARNENLSRVVIPTLSKDMDEHFKLVLKVVDVVDRANKDLCDSAAVQCGPAREILCSSPIICKEAGAREISSCLCELKT